MYAGGFIQLIFQKMSSGSSDMESLTVARGSTRFSAVFTRKWKIALSVSILLGAVAVIGICAAAVVAATDIGGKEGRRANSASSLETRDISSSEIYDDVEVGYAVNIHMH